MGLFEGAIFSDLNFFLVLVITLMGIIGLFSRFLVIGAYASFLTFIEIATEANIDLFTNLLYVFLALIFIFTFIRIWNITTSSPNQTGDM